MNRYHRQMLLPQIGPVGQERLRRSRALLVGCGALGTVAVEQLVRAGVGLLRICDRDLVEMTNLGRQVLFDEAAAAASVPKAIAAASRLSAINSDVRIDPHVVDVHSGNIERLLDGIDVVLDGTDNVETRYLVNDVAVKHGVPWVYGACVGTSGRVMGIVPGKTPCLRCVFPEPAGPGELPTCDTAGVLAATAGIVASLQVSHALAILLGEAPAEMVTVQLWPTRISTISTADARRQDCPTCGRQEFRFLEVRAGSVAAALCGRNTVQIRPAKFDGTVDIQAIAERLKSAGTVQHQPHYLRCELREGGLSLTVFCDGRAMVHGTADTTLARSIYAKFVGS
jgi:adenylyltransferase/sulfurtransferase